VTKYIAMTAVNLITPKAAAKHELLFDKPVSEVGLLNKSSHLAPTLGVTKFITTKCDQNDISYIYKFSHT
jgi:hypothetical protein